MKRSVLDVGTFCLFFLVELKKKRWMALDLESSSLLSSFVSTFYTPNSCPALPRAM